MTIDSIENFLIEKNFNLRMIIQFTKEIGGAMGSFCHFEMN